MTKTKEKTDYILFENYIYPKILKYLKDYPNDKDFGKKVRLLLEDEVNNNFPGVQNL